MEDQDKKIFIFSGLAVLFVIIFTIILVFLLINSKRGSLEVVSSPSDATVFIDEKEKGKTPITVRDLKTGKHIVKAKKTGLADAQKEVQIKKGNNEVSLTLEPTGINLSKLKAERLILTTNFEIRKEAGKKYIIFLKASYNRPNQYDLYIQRIKQYKKEALGWLRENGVDPDKSQIEYVPKEAKDL